MSLTLTPKQKASKKYYLKNKEKILKKKSLWQKKNREKINEYQKEWHSRPENLGKNAWYSKRSRSKSKYD